MPNTKSAIRRVRRASKQTFVNRIRKSKYKSIIKEIGLLITAKKKKEAIKLLPKFNSQLMKIAKVGVIKKKTASRKISRLTKKINKPISLIIDLYLLFLILFTKVCLLTLLTLRMADFVLGIKGKVI